LYRFDLHAEHDPSLAFSAKAATSPIIPRGRTSGAVRTVEVGLRPKLLSNCRQRRELISFVAEGSPDPYQASQRCSHRHPVPGFEPEIVFGAKIATKKIVF
jgi:hypothetical protein